MVLLIGGVVEREFAKLLCKFSFYNAPKLTTKDSTLFLFTSARDSVGRMDKACMLVGILDCLPSGIMFTSIDSIC